MTSLFPELLVNALGWTLLHSLWQGAFIALLLSLLLVLLHRQSAKVRYAVAGGAMLSQLLLAAGTFLYYHSQPEQASLSATASFKSTVSTTYAAELAVAPVQAPFWSEQFAVAQLYFEQHMPLLVTLWLLGMVVMAIRFIGGMAYTQRLCHYRATPLGTSWKQKMDAMREAMGVDRAVRLVESALVQVPMVVGFAKPVILLPVGAVTGLSQAQVEAILAHELAHILRRDYLVNLLQSVVDMLFFYHPAVWWMSGVVRAERENCCDDMAVAACGDTLTYARALAAIEAMRLPAAPAMAVALSGKRGTLMSRIKRLVGQQSLKPTFTEGFAAGLVLVVGLLVLSFGAIAGLKPQADQDSTLLQTNTAYEEATETMEEENTITNDPAGAFTYTVQDSTGRARDIVIIKNKKGKVKQLYVDGKRIPNRYIDDYKDLVDQRLQAVENAPRANRKEVALQMEQARAAVAETRQNSQGNYTFQYSYSNGDSLLVPPPPAPPVPPAPPAPAVAPVPPVPPVPPVAPLNEDSETLKEYDQELKAYEAEVKAYEEEIKGFEQEMKGYVEELSANGQLNGQHHQELAERQIKEAKRQTAHMLEMTKHQAEMSKQQQKLAQEHQVMARQHQENLQKVKDELVKDGIIKKGEDNLNIQLNNGEFYINGKKQPQEVYEKYKELMNIDVSDSSRFNFQYNSN
ncbi:M56 family metallopeptidase [Pontibacter pamirensis]|uniref:M56 family metallopeptidase n=1 Tax=Pontibacter pamirensis TaxID=2562824 RepID=UPI00192E36F4|nr:M56 family metallopeptidase [Pontibacter pamirensis]